MLQWTCDHAEYLERLILRALNEERSTEDEVIRDVQAKVRLALVGLRCPTVHPTVRPTGTS